MEQKHVSKELAQKLKQIGFDWLTSAHYHKKIEDIQLTINERDWNNLGVTRKYSSAPTIETAAKFLRERKGLHVYCYYSLFSNKWENGIQKIGQGTLNIHEIHDTHDDALTAGIEHAVDYELKKQNDALGKS